jgi:hypothetical protein
MLLLWILFSDDNEITLLEEYFFHLSDTWISSIADHVTYSINIIYKNEIEWPDKEEREATWGFIPVGEKIIAIVDGTHLRIDRPSSREEEQSYYSGYKGGHTQNYIVYINNLGFVLRVDGPFPGSMSDRGCVQLTDIHKSPSSYLSPGEKILADGGFCGEGEYIVPFNLVVVNKETTIRNALIDYNSAIADCRSLIERVFARIKDRARALRGTWRRSKEKQNNLFLAACRLYNRIQIIRIIFNTT